MQLKRFYCVVAGFRIRETKNEYVVDKHLSPFAVMAVDYAHALGMATMVQKKVEKECPGYTAWNVAVNEMPDEQGTVTDPSNLRVLPMST